MINGLTFLRIALVAIVTGYFLAQLLAAIAYLTILIISKGLS